MATKLNKTIRRVLEIEDIEVIVEIGPSGLAFRKPGKKTRAKISWDQTIDMVPRTEWCRDANRTLRMWLGIHGKSEAKALKKADDQAVKLKETERSVKMLLKEKKKLEAGMGKQRIALAELKRKFNRIKKIVKS